MDFRVLLAVGIAFGSSLAAPLTGPAQGPFPVQVARSRALAPPPAVAPVARVGSVLESSSVKSAVFRTIHYQRQVEGVPLGGGFEQLPLKQHLPVWVF